MERLNRAKIYAGDEYDHLFPEPDWEDTVIKKSARLEDTLKQIPEVIFSTLEDTRKIAKKLKRKNHRETLRAIWLFVHHHIPYRRDEKGKEQLRRPSRLWFERKKRKDGSDGGGDCDCYTIFIGSTMVNLAIYFIPRITKNTEPFFQHIYPISPTGDGGYITIDCVVDEFDHEAPYYEKKDIEIMELHYLSGLGSAHDETEALEARDYSDEILDFTEEGETVDIGDFLDGLDDLGFLRKFRKKAGKFFKKVGKSAKVAAKKLVHVVNKINPVALLLRNGLLAAMKINMMKVAERIKYAYLSPMDAERQNLDMGKHAKLQKTMGRLQKIFYGAGGKPDNLKKAILTGKGNRDRSVAGLGMPFDDMDYNENSTLREILGEEIYREEVLEELEGAESLEGFEGFGELGEPATAAALASASGAVAAIKALLDKIGDIKKKADPIVTDIKDIRDTVRDFDTVIRPMPELPSTFRQDAIVPQPNPSMLPEPRISQSGQRTAQGQFPTIQTAPKDAPPPEEKSWLRRNALGVSLAGAGTAALLWAVYSSANADEGDKTDDDGKEMNGVKRKKRTYKKRKPTRKGTTAKEPVALL